MERNDSHEQTGPEERWDGKAYICYGCGRSVGLDSSYRRKLFMAARERAGDQGYDPETYYWMERQPRQEDESLPEPERLTFSYSYE